MRVKSQAAVDGRIEKSLVMVKVNKLRIRHASEDMAYASLAVAMDVCPAVCATVVPIRISWQVISRKMKCFWSALLKRKTEMTYESARKKSPTN